MPRITAAVIERAEAMLAQPDAPSRREVAKALGLPESSLRYHLNGRQHASGKSAGAAAQTTVEVKGDDATVTTAEGATPDQVLELIRENGLDPDDWVIVGTRLNKWDGPVKGGGKQPLRQVRVDLKRKNVLAGIVPKPSHFPALFQEPARASVHEPDLIVVEGDHQAPYHDPRLHRASLGLLHDLQPAEHHFLGDTADYPTVSKFADHPAAMAAVNAVNQAATDLLADKVKAAPRALRKKLEGNHDWRVEGELLQRAERMHGVTPAMLEGEEPQIPLMDLRRMLRLPELGIELVKHPKGWMHGEIEIVPGPKGLLVRHGWLTGETTAAKTLRARGRSVIVGHNHTKEHFFKLDYGVETLRQAVVAGTMSRNDEVFPHFAAVPNWHQGLVTVSRWRDGRFQIEHAVYYDGALTWRDLRWEA